MIRAATPLLADYFPDLNAGDKKLLLQSGARLRRCVQDVVDAVRRTSGAASTRHLLRHLSLVSTSER